MTLETPRGSDIGVNVIVPFAYTNMSAVSIDQVMGEGLSGMIQPDRIAPVVGWLCSQTNAHRGQIFHASSLRTTRIGIVESAPVSVDAQDVGALNAADFKLEPVFEPADSATAVGRLLGG